MRKKPTFHSIGVLIGAYFLVTTLAVISGLLAKAYSPIIAAVTLALTVLDYLVIVMVLDEIDALRAAVRNH